MYPCTHDPIIYRGWMMKPEEYKEFYHFLKNDVLINPGIILMTSPEQYKTMHQFPDIYNQIKEDTPKIMTFPLHDYIDIRKIRKNLGICFLIKDFVKK